MSFALQNIFKVFTNIFKLQTMNIFGVILSQKLLVLVKRFKLQNLGQFKISIISTVLFTIVMLFKILYIVFISEILRENIIFSIRIIKTFISSLYSIKSVR